MNRAQRRAVTARSRREGDIAAVVDTGTLFLPDETSVDLEVLVRRTVARMEAQIGCPVPHEYRTGFEDRIRASLQNIDRRERGLPPIGSAKSFSEEALEEGRRRLAGMLPRAMGIARGEAADGGHLAPWIIDAFRKHAFRLGDLEAVMVYRTEPGVPHQGWHGDVVLGRVMDPLPNMIGTPTAEPCRTREEAEARALELLAMCCFHAKAGFDA